MVGIIFFRRSLLFVLNMVLKFLLWMVLMCLMENQRGMPVPETKQMMTISEEKYTLVSLIKLVKSLIIGLMRSIWSYSLVCQPSVLSNSFASFDARKVRRLAEFYPKDFSNNDLLKLELQLDNYIDDMRQDASFQGLDNIVDLSVKLVETKRHKVYDMVYLLLKLILLLPVATASVERVFSALVIVKTKSRNKIGDTVLDDCLVTFIEQDVFFQVNEDDIMETFMSLRKRWINK